MPALAFDTLAFAKKLQDGGFTVQQAEVLTQAQAELFEQNLATKLDFKELETTLTRDLKELEVMLTRDLKELETTLTRDMKGLEYRMVIKLGGLMLIGITVIATLVKLFS